MQGLFGVLGDKDGTKMEELDYKIWYVATSLLMDILSPIFITKHSKNPLHNAKSQKKLFRFSLQ